MVAGNTKTIAFNRTNLSYTDACEISNRASDTGIGATICIELDRVAETTTAALARLVVLRRDLRRSGRDLRLAGLQGRAEHLFEFNGMGTLLPRCRREGNGQETRVEGENVKLAQQTKG